MPRSGIPLNELLGDNVTEGCRQGKRRRWPGRSLPPDADAVAEAATRRAENPTLSAPENRPEDIWRGALGCPESKQPCADWKTPRAVRVIATTA